MTHVVSEIQLDLGENELFNHCIVRRLTPDALPVATSDSWLTVNKAPHAIPDGSPGGHWLRTRYRVRRRL
jgi:hypothetical protein